MIDYAPQGGLEGGQISAPDFWEMSRAFLQEEMDSSSKSARKRVPDSHP